MDVTLPKLGEGSDSGTVVSILVKEGDRVEQGHVVMELENEKAVAPVPSSGSGIVKQLRVKVGDKVMVGQVLLQLEDGAGSPAMDSQPRVSGVAGRAMATGPALAAGDQGDRAATQQEEVGRTAGQGPVREGGAGVAPVAPPWIRRAARELGLDLGKVRGTGPGGRIGAEDVRAYVQWLEAKAHGSDRDTGVEGSKNRAVEPEAARIEFSQWGPVEKRPFSTLRKTISRRLTESWTTIPHVTQFEEVDITELQVLRKKGALVWEPKGVKLTLTPFALKAAVTALKKHPAFNASLDEARGELVLKAYYHMGLAVDTEQGLLVPVVRDVDKKGLIDLAREINDLGERARARKLSLEEMRGGTFTISNQGGFGGGAFTPIVNKPEVAILGLGRAMLKPVVREGRVEPRWMMPMGLSYDHRVIDGGSAARFTVDLAAAFQAFTEADLAT